MKDWLRTHYRIIIALAIFIAAYLILYHISMDYIGFRRVFPSENRAMMEFNMKVARHYFVYLPLGASIPSLLYMLVVFFNNKSK